MRARAILTLLALAALAACNSPEATRTRAGGAGADTGNRSRVVKMHEGSRPYWKTPLRLGERIGADYAVASQADRLSRGEAPAASPR